MAKKMCLHLNIGTACWVGFGFRGMCFLAVSEVICLGVNDENGTALNSFTLENLRTEISPCQR